MLTGVSGALQACAYRCISLQVYQPYRHVLTGVSGALQACAYRCISLQVYQQLPLQSIQSKSIRDGLGGRAQGGRAQTVAYMAKWLLNRCCLCSNPVQICSAENFPIFPLGSARYILTGFLQHAEHIFSGVGIHSKFTKHVH